MSYTAGINVSLYASDRESPFHDAATANFLRALKPPRVLAIGRLRVATHPPSFERPLTPRAVTDHIAGVATSAKVSAAE